MSQTSEALLLLKNSDIQSREPQNTVISPASETNLNSSTSFGHKTLTLPVTHLNLSPKEVPFKSYLPSESVFKTHSLIIN